MKAKENEITCVRKKQKHRFISKDWPFAFTIVVKHQERPYCTKIWGNI